MLKFFSSVAISASLVASSALPSVAAMPLPGDLAVAKAPVTEVQAPPPWLRRPGAVPPGGRQGANPGGRGPNTGGRGPNVGGPGGRRGGMSGGDAAAIGLGAAIIGGILAGAAQGQQQPPPPPPDYGYGPPPPGGYGMPPPPRGYRMPPPHVWDAHVRWCMGRYRSYNPADNSFQPYNAPRQPCISPYWR